MKIIILDKRELFLADVQTQLIIEDRDIYLVGQSTSSSGIVALIESGHPDYLVIADNILREQENWNFPNLQTIGYCSFKSAENPFDKHNIPSYGYIESPEHLLNLLSVGIPEVKQTAKNDGENIEVAKIVESTSISETPKIEEPPAFYTQDTSFDETRSKASTPEKPAEIYNKPNYIEQESELKNEELAQDDIFELANKKNKSESVSLLNQEFARKKKETKVVTVYAAKGGVGKTTISTSLATYLSCVSEGRERLRVCLIDCNIDFGDVISTLEYTAKGVNLTYWVGEVKDRLERGEHREDIQYSQAEIEARLQKSKTGLYALLAPTAHEDSMGIEYIEEKIIFDNIVQNGGFDYVICDTGNNTRDFSVLALKEADIVLLVQTQDISTASCNKAFLNTMKKAGFDTTKVRNVFNVLMSDNATELALKDLETIFPYPCIAYINYDSAVRKHNNKRSPLVLTNTNHQFTKEIQKIASHVMGESANISKKRGLFKRLKDALKGD